MKNTNRALFGVSALALLLAATPVFAAQVDVTAENTHTGADSDNRNNWDIDHNLDAEVNNTADVDNVANADVRTGDNDQSRNTSGGSLESGNVEAAVDWENVVNASTALAGAADNGLEVTADFSNDTTGADSDNRNTLNVDNNVDLDLSNDANIDNNIDFDARTGNNDQTRNTEAGNLKSGDVSLDAMIANWANNDSGFAGAAAGAASVDVSASNHKTGADSDNRNTVNVDHKINLTIDNDANIDNKISVDARTGDNDQSRNTKGGKLETGKVDVSASIENKANNGGGLAGAASHNVDVKAKVSNDTTGADSDNRNTVNLDNNVKVDVSNDANIDNRLNVDANTGDNDQKRNTEAGDVKTGDVKIKFNVSNEVNSN